MTSPWARLCNLAAEGSASALRSAAGPAQTASSGQRGPIIGAVFFNTTFWVAPAEELIGILMTQIFPSASDIQERFRIMAYQAIVERE